ncbi:MAG: hypothetical protein ACLPY1_19235 [Terracidiphilus sp.]
MALGVRVMMVVVMMMVMPGRKRRSGKHHQKQGSSEDLFHATNVARPPQREKRIQCRASREARGVGSSPNMEQPRAILHICQPDEPR